MGLLAALLVVRPPPKPHESEASASFEIVMSGGAPTPTSNGNPQPNAAPAQTEGKPEPTPPPAPQPAPQPATPPAPKPEPEPAPEPPPEPVVPPTPVPPAPEPPVEPPVKPPPTPPRPAAPPRVDLQASLPMPPPVPLPPLPLPPPPLPPPLLPPRPRPPRPIARPVPPEPRSPSGFPMPQNWSLSGSGASHASPQGGLGHAEMSGPQQPAPLITGAELGRDWISAYKAWVQARLYYPEQAAENGEDGTAEVILKINRFGRVESVDLVGRSGSQWLDLAIQSLFRGRTVPAFPPGTKEDEATIDQSIHYILRRR